jgi:hypothetical protein
MVLLSGGAEVSFRGNIFGVISSSSAPKILEVRGGTGALLLSREYLPLNLTVPRSPTPDFKKRPNGLVGHDKTDNLHLLPGFYFLIVHTVPVRVRRYE